MTSCKNCAFWKLEQEEIGDEDIFLNTYKCSNEYLRERLENTKYERYKDNDHSIFSINEIKECDNCSLFIRVGDIVNKEDKK